MRKVFKDAQGDFYLVDTEVEEYQKISRAQIEAHKADLEARNVKLQAIFQDDTKLAEFVRENIELLPAYQEYQENADNIQDAAWVLSQITALGG